jgi:hypothetical protein
MDAILQKEKNTSLTIRLSESLKKELQKKVIAKVLELSTPEELYSFTISDLITEALQSYRNLNIQASEEIAA